MTEQDIRDIQLGDTMEHALFRSLKLHGKWLTECVCIPITEDSMHLYVLPHDYKGGGFDFAVTDYVSSSGASKPHYDLPDLEVEVIMHGVAFHDGLRHVYFGDQVTDSVGYLNYCDALELAAVFMALRECERKWCNSPPDNLPWAYPAKKLLEQWDKALAG
jgi:hypothetical protein